MTLELRLVVHYVGLLLITLSVLIGAIGGFAGYDHLVGNTVDRADLAALLATAAAGIAFGALLFAAGRGRRTSAALLGRREALFLVGLAWLLGAGLAALPYWFWAWWRSDAGLAPHSFDSLIGCYFEAMSGLTTTGATVVEKIATLPRSLLLWRALTHWLGGLGIVVLFVAVFPLLGVGSRRVYRIEAAGPSPEGVKPRMQDAARALWYIYLLLTAAEFTALLLCGMSSFDAICHTFATLATGGFSTNDASIAAFPSRAIQFTIIVFMFLSGVNFGLYHRTLQGQWRSVRKDPEFRAYLWIVVAASVIVSAGVWTNSHTASAGASSPRGLFDVVFDSVFQVVSIQTTTGFCNTDFDQWGFPAEAMLVVLMFVGACAGSTGGGVKVVRVIIGFRVVLAEIEQIYRPNVVRPIKVGRTTIDDDLKRNTLVYLIGIGLLFAGGTILLMLLERGQGIDITTAATATAATLNNIGPGLAKVGATKNYAWFCSSSHVVMSLLMVLGRLEMFTIVALLTPRFWKEE